MLKKRSKGKKAAPETKSGPKKKPSYFDETMSWETDKVVSLKKSEFRAWVVAGIAVVVALASVLGVSALAPLKTVEPFVIRVDNNTGIVDVVSNLKTTETNYEEVINRYWLNQYVKAREAHLWQTRDHDYRLVGLLSAQAEQQRYAAHMNPKNNPLSPLNIYGEAARVNVKVKTINFLKDNVAIVRFSKRVERAGESPLPTHWASTLVFTYVPGTMKEEDRRDNPLGFQVVEYRATPEVE